MDSNLKRLRDYKARPTRTPIQSAVPTATAKGSQRDANLGRWKAHRGFSPTPTQSPTNTPTPTATSTSTPTPTP
jgi:hypothetical protein